MHDVRLIGTTDAEGDLAVASERTVNGKLYKIEWMGSNFDEGVEINIYAVDAVSGTTCTLLANDSGGNVDSQFYPRAQLCTTNGSLKAEYVQIHFDGVLHLVVAGGGAGNKGGCNVHYENEAA